MCLLLSFRLIMPIHYPEEVDTDTKLQLVSQREQIQSRLEALTKNSAQSSEAAHSEQDRQADQSPQNEAPPLASAPLNAPNSLVPVAPRWLSFDILFSVERVKVYILYGNQRELINDGTVAALRILKGTESSNLGDIAILQLNLCKSHCIYLFICGYLEINFIFYSNICAPVQRDPLFKI